MQPDEHLNALAMEAFTPTPVGSTAQYRRRVFVGLANAVPNRIKADRAGAKGTTAQLRREVLGEIRVSGKHVCGESRRIDTKGEKPSGSELATARQQTHIRAGFNNQCTIVSL